MLFCKKQQFKNSVCKQNSLWLHFNIKGINNNQILTCSNDKSIKLSDIYSKRELFKIKNTHTTHFNALEYDYNNEIVILSSSSKSIKFLRTNGSLVFNRKNAHKEEIASIQLVNDFTLLSVSRNELKLWKINFGKNDFIQIRQQQCDETTIYCAQSIFNHTLIVNINANHIQFFDYDLKIIDQIMHDDEEICTNYFMRVTNHENQLDTLEYVFLTGPKYVKVLKRIQ